MTGGAAALSYGSRRVWWMVTLGVTVLGLLELLVGHLILARLFGPPWITVADVALIAATVALTGMVASPLAAAPRLTDTELVLGFGLLGGARLPLTDVTDVVEQPPSPLASVPPGAAVDGEPPVATFSLGAGGGYVRIELDPPAEVRHSLWRRGLAATVVVRLDEPAAAAEAVRAAAASTQRTP